MINNFRKYSKNMTMKLTFTHIKNDVFCNLKLKNEGWRKGEKKRNMELSVPTQEHESVF